jgi:hypothetical protein
MFSLQARDDEPQITMFGQDLPFIKESAAASSRFAFSFSSRRMRSFLLLNYQLPSHQLTILEFAVITD